MLKRFFLNTLSSFLGAWIALVIMGVVAVLFVVGVVAKIGMSQKTQQSVKKGSILTIDLDGIITENDSNPDFDYSQLILGGELEKKNSLSELTSAIEAAAENHNVKAIYLKCGLGLGSPATYNALRTSLLKFKESGKKIFAYGNIMSQSVYYVATVADELYMNPGGKLNIKGLGATTIFLTGLLEKLGIHIQVVKVGTFKSAVEPFINTELSGPARAQLDTLYGTMWDYIAEGIATSRPQLSVEKINELIDDDFIFLKDGRFAEKAGLVDKVYYERSIDSIIASSLGKDKEDLNFIGSELLVSQEKMLNAYSAKTQIAVLYASGDIVDGGTNSEINYQRYVPIITKLAEDDNVKGMVLRVNSPGGSAFGSEQIGDALDYFKAKGKPLAVSMGDYAASGGYWISCGADRIFANPLTITGSIGIFGIIPNISGLIHKIGITTSHVATNPDANFPNLITEMNPRQYDAMQSMVNQGYDQFINRVATGRHMSEEKVRQIGEGRVWDAQKALSLGLVDQLGNLQDAINWVASEIHNQDYVVSSFPKSENSIWNFLPGLMDMHMNIEIKTILGEQIPKDLNKKVYNILNHYPVQARMPEFITSF